MSKEVLYYVNRVCDRRRWRKEVRELRKKLPEEMKGLVHEAWVSEEGRLVVADLAEEYGFPYLSMFLRNHLTNEKPKWPKRRFWSRRK